MQPESTPAMSGTRAVLLILGGLGVLAILASIWHEHSLAIVRALLWPFAIVATAANLKPGDIDFGSVLMVFLVGSVVVFGLAGPIIGIVDDVRRARRRMH